MIRRLLLLPFLLLITLSLQAEPSVSTDDIIHKSSKHSVKQTMDRLESIVKEKGLTIFARIDHQAGAEKVGMKMAEAEVLIFGNPKMGTAIMKFDTAAGLDLPLRVLVFADKDGKTTIAYHNPQALRKHYAVAESPALVMAEGALGKITSEAAN